MISSIFRKKSTEFISEHDSSLKKTLDFKSLTILGIAAIIGAGIFSTIGQAAYDGGPAIIFLFIITAITCGFTALCYAEFASRTPVSGSAYTYAYMTLGEIVAWIIGWSLILEYAIGNVVVAISWSSYFDNILTGIGIHLPAWLLIDPNTAKDAFLSNNINSVGYEAYSTAPMIGTWKVICNLPAFLIVVIVTFLAYIGISESQKSARAMVIFKLLVLLVVIVVGVFYIQSDNYVPFMPKGFQGVLAGVSAVFYAYIGFDAISTTAEECKNPQRDLPRSMIASLVICTIIYMVIALVLTGIVHYSEFQYISDPLAFIFKDKLPWLEKLISFSALIATTGVLLVFQLGQPRIWMSMSRDGLLPKKFSKIHSRFRTPSFATIITGVLVAIPSLFIDSNLVTDLTSIGTLAAFCIVCIGVLLLPTLPKESGKFRLPKYNSRIILPILTAIYCYSFGDKIWMNIQTISSSQFSDILSIVFYVVLLIMNILAIIKNLSLIPVLGLLCCTFLMIEIPQDSWYIFIYWMAIGLLIYFLYGKKRSKLQSVKEDK